MFPEVVLKTLIVKPVTFDPLNVKLEAIAVLNELKLASPVTKIETSPTAAVAALVFIDNPVTAVDVVSFAIQLTITLPLPMFGAENIPVPVIFAKVTSLVVATACPIETVGVDAFPVPPVTVTPVPPDTVAAKSPLVMLLV
jgi:hypothetical protein